MLHKFKITLSLVAFFAAVSISYGQNASSTASAVVLSDLTIALEAGTAIDFGVLATNTPGTVRLDPNSFSNNVSVNPTTANVARFNVTGEAGSIVNVTYDQTVNLVDTVDPTLSMTMTSIVVGDQVDTNQETAAVIAADGPATLSAPGGLFFIWVGGTLPQLVNQAAGTYQGTFNISVAYN